MRGLAADSLLGLWEQGDGLPPLDRALLLAGGLEPDPDRRDRPLGEVHRRLLDLRRAVLGTDLTATAACPSCEERVEFGLDVDDLQALAAEPVGDLTTPGGRPVTARPPTVADLAAVTAERDPVAALTARCVTVADGGSLAADDLAAVEAALAAADPLAEVLVELACPRCGSAFEADLDVGAFVWAELDVAARRLLAEVDQLARAYGWTEPQVLALSEARRATYLRLVTEGVP